MISTTPKPLAKRLIVAFMTMVILLGSGYCLALWHSIGVAESTLIGRSLEIVLQETLQSSPLKSSSLFTIYADGPEAAHFDPIPAELKKFPYGFSEVTGRQDFFLLKKQVGATTWVVLQDQHGFEEQEILIFTQALLSLILATGAAALVGYILSRAITIPIRSLAQEVQTVSREKQFTPLKTALAQDEIGTLAKTFEQTLFELHQSLLREKSFTADVSHELRTPLTIISTTAELLSLNQTDPALMAKSQTILRAAQRLNRLIVVFLELARNQSGGHLREQTSLLGVAENSVQTWLPAAQKKGLTLSLVSHLTQPVSVNKPLSESLLDNLIRNAVQYTQTGSVVVTLEPDRLCVTDSGCGISSADQERILKAFVRGQNTCGDGYGWGLSLIQRICQHENWRLEFAANPPHGTRFTVFFDAREHGRG